VNRNTLLACRDFLFLLFAAFFFLGCVASSHRSGKTLDQGQFSVGGSYTGVSNMDESEADMIQLIALDGRVGVLNGLDAGIMHTWDITDENEGVYSAVWGDIKWQVTNKDETPGMPILALGIMKGYVYDDLADTHVTSFPISVSMPVRRGITPFFLYRFEQMSEDFIPDEFGDPRHGFFLGSEFELGADAAGTWTPKLGLSVGTLNSLGGGEGDQQLVLSAGVSVDSPR
jgi:hypothetical protein